MTARRTAARRRALFLGFGNVGRAAAQVLASRGAHPGLAELDVAVVGIVTGAHGSLVNARGIDLAAALEHWRRHGRFTAAHPDHAAPDALAAVRALDYDVMVEMTPLGREARGEPAITHVREALGRGRHVISANKAPLAWAFRELRGLADANGVAFLHEATVMDGVPVFNLARHGLRGVVVTRLDGILNSTTNVVLCALERGGSFEEALAQAQSAGTAEADPKDDLEGWDAAVKICALANVLMQAELRPEDVAREGIVGLDPARPAAALSRGARLKLVAEAWREGSAVLGRVALHEIPLDHSFALVEGTSSILRLATDLAGTLVLTEERPDIRVTAYGVISDLLALPPAERRRTRRSTVSPAPRSRPATSDGSRSRRGGRAR
jgi:homoserine dehydrogenase